MQESKVYNRDVSIIRYLPLFLISNLIIIFKASTVSSAQPTTASQKPSDQSKYIILILCNCMSMGLVPTCSLEWFSFECRKTKTKVITLANHIGHRQYIEPIKTRSNYMWLTQSAGKCMRARHNWLWFYF